MHTEPLFTIGKFSVHLYGIFIGIGVLCCLFVYFFYTKKRGVPSSIQDLGFYSAVVAIGLGFLFAKISQAFFVYLTTGVFNFSSAGMTAMAGFIWGAIFFVIVYFGVGAYIFKGEKKGLHIKHFNSILLIAGPCISIAHAFGRIGCLMAGCCHGAYLGKEPVANGIWMTPHNAPAGYYVPMQLYEALFLFVLFAILTILYFKRFNITHVVYLALYGFWRFIVEFFRADDRGFFLGLYPSQWVSILFILVAIILVVIYKVKKKPFILPFLSDLEKDKKEKQ